MIFHKQGESDITTLEKQRGRSGKFSQIQGCQLQSSVSDIQVQDRRWGHIFLKQGNICGEFEKEEVEKDRGKERWETSLKQRNRTENGQKGSSSSAKLEGSAHS